jgi:uncharacterized cupin superfamily protein
MEGVGRVNLGELEDMAAKMGFGDVQEARFGGKPLGCERIGLALEHVKPGKRGATAHVHRDDEEVYVVIAGSGIAKVGDEEFELREMDALRVAPTVPRGFEAGPGGLKMIAFGTHTPDDAELLQDFWDD